MPIRVCLATMVLLLASASAEAKTEASGGAVAQPAGLCVRAPFADGERFRVSSGYGPDGGSGYHEGTTRDCCANDYYALDLILLDHPDNGLGQPIVAVAEGTVVLAGLATEGWASYGQRVVLEHTFEDGHSYSSMYGHMDTVSVSVGDTLRAGEQVGTLGGSSGGSQNGTAYHLHFALYQDSQFGGSGTGGAYSGRAVVPEPLGTGTDLVPGTEVVASAGSCDVDDDPNDPNDPDDPDDANDPDPDDAEDDGKGRVQEIGYCSNSGGGSSLFFGLVLLALVFSRRSSGRRI